MEQYKDLIAGSSDEDEYASEVEKDENEQQHKEEMRKKLMEGLDDDSLDNFKHRKNRKDLQDSDDDELDV